MMIRQGATCTRAERLPLFIPARRQRSFQLLHHERLIRKRCCQATWLVGA